MNTKYNYLAGDDTDGPVSAADLLKLGNEAKSAGGNLSYCREGDSEWLFFNETIDDIIEESRSGLVSQHAGKTLGQPGRKASSEESPAAFLQRVRRQTSYGALRGVMMVVLALSIIVTVIISIIFMTELRGGNAFTVFVGMILAIIVQMAVWQWSVTFVDMADTLIEQNRKKKS